MATRGNLPCSVSAASTEVVISTTDLSMSTLSCLETATSQCEVSVDSNALDTTLIQHAAYQAPFVFQAQGERSLFYFFLGPNKREKMISLTLFCPHFFFLLRLRLILRKFNRKKS